MNLGRSTLRARLEAQRNTSNFANGTSAADRRGKSWAPWMFLLHEHIADPAPETQLRQAVEWAVRDARLPPTPAKYLLNQGFSLY